MAKFYGKIGYSETVETSPDVWEDQIVERVYRGDVNRISRKWEKSDGVNDDLNVSHEISIIADAYACEHFSAIKYVEWMGAKWKVPSVEVQRPRLILSIGGVWNGHTA